MYYPVTVRLGEALRKLKVGTPISIQNRPELAQVSTIGGASLQAGTMVMKMVAM